MNFSHEAILTWIDSQAPEMERRLIEWGNINTGSANQAGLERFGGILCGELERLGAEVKRCGRAVCAVKRGESKARVLLNIHMDTVYAADSAFQSCTRIDARTLQGPGVADAKGGIVVMLTALAAVERSGVAQDLGWEVLINPDEEIGSKESLPLLTEAARRNRVGLLFEPATADGALIDRRKGSGTFKVMVHGRAAHAGRDFANGRNAVAAAARLALELDAINGKLPGVTLNVGAFSGGGAVNVVPDFAQVQFNIRTTEVEDEKKALELVRQSVAELNSREGFKAELSGEFHAAPKIPDEKTRRLMGVIERCGGELNVPIQWKASGGASDGNKLAAAGLANVDTLGPCGGNLHNPGEFVLLDTLADRAKLTALVLLKLANGEGM